MLIVPERNPELNIHWLKENKTQEEVMDFLGSLSMSELEALQKDYYFLARPSQIPPDTNWERFIALAGRGFGKTWAGTQFLRECAKRGIKRMGAVAPTQSDHGRVMVFGASGFMETCWEGDYDYSGKYMGMPKYSPTHKTLSWANGAKVEFFSAEDPERLRGPQFEVVWGDELCAWTRMSATFEMIEMCLRLKNSDLKPRLFITTTPKPSELLKSLVADGAALEDIESGRTILVTGSSYENSDNIDLSAMKRKEGTRLGEQELHGKILWEAAGAFWTKELIEASYVDDMDVPEFIRVVIGVDPAMSNEHDSDETGIVVVGVDINNHGYVVGDYTAKYSPDEVANKVAELWDQWDADLVICEGNQGKMYVRDTILKAHPYMNLQVVNAKVGKVARAEPVAALYERGLIHHVLYPKEDSGYEVVPARLNKLEDQMTQWESASKSNSPDRIDALVWAITATHLKGRVHKKLQIKRL